MATVWGNWVTASNTTNAITVTGTNWYAPTWESWQTTSATTANIIVDQIWDNWHDQNQYHQYRVVRETPEEMALRREREEARLAQARAQQREFAIRHQTEMAERAAQIEAAQAKAMELLRVFLTDEQEKSMDEQGFFEVIGRRAMGGRGHRWRIYTGRSYSGNVVLMPDIGEVRDATYCAHLPYADDQGREIPKADHWLAQKLALETNEDAWLDVANVQVRNPEPSQEIPSRFTRRVARQRQDGVLVA